MCGSGKKTALANVTENSHSMRSLKQRKRSRIDRRRDGELVMPSPHPRSILLLALGKQSQATSKSPKPNCWIIGPTKLHTGVICLGICTYYNVGARLPESSDP